MKTCEHCGRQLKAWARADARFCSTRCRVAHHRSTRADEAAGLPVELTTRARWVNHVNKRPMCARTGAWASVTDPTTWSTYEAASATGAPLGFVLGDGVGCIDLDACLDENGIPNEATRTLLAYYEGSYVEISPPDADCISGAPQLHAAASSASGRGSGSSFTRLADTSPSPAMRTSMGRSCPSDHPQSTHPPMRCFARRINEKCPS